MIDVYTLPRSTWLPLPLLHLGDTVWWPFCRCYVVPCSVKACNFVIGYRDDAHNSHHHFVYPDAVTLDDAWYTPDCYIASSFYTLDEPIGHSVQLWTPMYDYATGYDDCYVSLAEALKHVVPCGPGNRRARVALKHWRRRRVAGLNRYGCPDITIQHYPVKQVYYRRK